MRKLKHFILILLIGSLSTTINAKQLDRIVAVVNDDVITQSELKQAVRIIDVQAAHDPAATPALKEKLRRELLDQMINKKLQLQLAKQAHVEITDEELDHAIQTVAKDNHLSVAMLYQKLSEEGMPKAAYRREMREQMVMRKLQQQELASRINITPQEVTNYIHSSLWQNNRSKIYRLADILIPLSDAPSSDELTRAKERANSIYNQLRQKVAFNETLKKLSIQSVDLGWRQLPEVPSAFAEHIIQMQQNEVSEPIRTGNGFHIIQVTAIKDKQNKEALNQKQIENLLLQRKFEEAMVHWLSKLRSQAYVVIKA